ncbi:MAG: peptidylprolyl isomerase [Kiritimatiellia bacterium]
MKMIGTIGTLAVATLAVVGCGKKDGGAADEAKPAEKTAAAAPVDKAAVMVRVNGKALTRGEIDADVATFIEARKAQIPPEQVEEVKKHVGEQIAQTFVMKTILLAEADKKGVKVTDEDRKKHNDDFVKANAKRPDAPKSLQEAAEKHPLGKERGLKELEESFRIQKLLDQEVVAKVTVDAKKVAETIQNITSNNQEMAKKALDAEAKIKTLAKQLEGLKGDALAKKFAELAKANSDCPSKEKGGDLGEFTHGQMVKEFDEVAFKSEPLTVSAPVKTQFGWHLIMVTKKVPAVEAKGDQPASPEKVQASHILVSARAPQPVPSKEDVEKGLKRQEEQRALRTYFDALRAAATIEAPGFPSLAPAPKAPAPKAVESKPVAAKPAAQPAKPIESKPVEVKPVESKPAEAKK